MRACGIDPGSTPHVCVFNPDASERCGLRWQFFDVPSMLFGVSSERVDAFALSTFLQRTSPDKVFVENVGPRPMARGRAQGVASTSKFLRAAGYCEAVPMALGFPVVPVAPQTWKRYFEIPSYGDDTKAAKEHSRRLMLQLEPSLCSMLKRKLDHGRAEAALIAMYGAHCIAA